MTLRIVAGKHRGRRLEGPKDRRIRPTALRVREAIFDWLAHRRPSQEGDPFPAGERVLDAFAGSGAMGFEALSRGAAFVTFLETDAKAVAILQKNAASLGEEARVAILRRDARRPGHLSAPVGLAILDPPYGQDLGGPSLAVLRREGWLRQGAVVVLETGARELCLLPEGFRLLDERRYGEAKALFLGHEMAETPVQAPY